MSGIFPGGPQISHLSFTQNMSLQEVGFLTSKSGTVTGTAGFGSSLFLQRLCIPAAMTLTEFDIAIGLAFPATNQGAGTLSQSFAMYSFGNSTSLASVMSFSSSSAWSTGTSTTAGAASLTEFQGGWAGSIIQPMTFASSSISAGEYVIGYLQNFAQGSSTWTVSLFGQLGQASLTQQLVTAVNTSTTSYYSSLANLAITNVEATKTFASSAGSVVSVGINAVARSIHSASTTTGNLVSSVSGALVTVTMGPPALANFGFIGTGSTTSGFPTAFTSGIMSTGAVPAAITLTSTAVTMSGSVALVQPWFALVGA